jgi:hypothetical protein
MIFMDSAIDGLLYFAWGIFCLKVSEGSPLHDRARRRFRPSATAGYPAVGPQSGVTRPPGRWDELLLAHP